MVADENDKDVDATDGSIVIGTIVDVVSVRQSCASLALSSRAY